MISGLLALALLTIPAAKAETAIPPAVAAHESDMGFHFTTAAGFTIYTYDSDEKPLKSTCVAQCAKAWPPVAADADAKPVGEWMPFDREDGTRQWAFRGKPVYTYAQDPQPGATLGDGVVNIWHVAIALKPRPPGFTFRGTVIGRVAADPVGKTVYVRTDGTCTGTCLRSWAPVSAPWSAKAQGDWSIVVRSDDASPQWAWRGKPLYTYRAEMNPGELRGQGADKVWRAIVVQPAPALPPGVSIHASDLGPTFTDEKGLTLYNTADLAKMAAEASCPAACLKTYWRPFVAPAGAKPVGNWSISAQPDGSQQWFYRALPVFTFVEDSKVGEINGEKFASPAGGPNGGFRPLLEASLKEEVL